MNAYTTNELLRRAIRPGRGRLISILALTLTIGLFVTAQAGAAPDRAPVFVSPGNGESVEGTVLVSVYVPDFSVFRAEVGVDGQNWRPMNEKGGGHYYLWWNSAEVHRGKHILTARFTFEPGRPPVMAISIAILVDNEEPDAWAGLMGPLCLPVVRPVSILHPYCPPPGT